MLTSNLKKFLENNIELIEANRFGELYKKAETDLEFPQGIGNLTRTLLKAELDPLPHLTEIPYCYLYGDSSITTFNIPDHIDFIDSAAFVNCSVLKAVTFGRNVSVVSYGAFENCKQLETVALNEGLLAIDQYVFKNTNISKLKLPSTLKRIDFQAFPKI